MAIKLDVKQVLTRSTTSVSRSRMLTRDLFAVANLVIDRRKTAEVLTSAPQLFDVSQSLLSAQCANCQLFGLRCQWSRQIINSKVADLYNPALYLADKTGAWLS